MFLPGPFLSALVCHFILQSIRVVSLRNEFAVLLRSRRKLPAAPALAVSKLLLYLSSRSASATSYAGSASSGIHHVLVAVATVIGSLAE